VHQELAEVPHGKRSLFIGKGIKKDEKQRYHYEYQQKQGVWQRPVSALHKET
jgi:hypothetical protein